MNTESSGVEQKKIQVKEKIVIKEREYTDQLINCSQSAFWSGCGAFLGVVFSVPFIIKRLKFIPTSVEVRAVTGFISALVAAQQIAETTKKNCDKKLAEKYDYIPYEL